MFYNAPTHDTANAPRKNRRNGIIIAAVVICLVVFIALVVLAIGLGVGLGVGLSRRNSGSSNAVSNPGSNAVSNAVSSAGSSGASSVITPSSSSSALAAPTVNCVYNVSTTCGCAATQPSFPSSRIFNGQTAVTNSWPWVVVVLSDNGQVLCGGFLISYQYVLTAAHCVSGLATSGIQVYGGIQKLSEEASGQIRTLSSYTAHPNYSPATFANDIAVLTLASPMDQTSDVGVCCLPSDTSSPRIGDIGVIAGWGYPTASSNAPSDDLLQGVIQVQPDSTSCITNTTSAVQFCASNAGTDACNGDSGSPFMVNVNNAWTCAGMVSTDKKCGQTARYTRVSAFRSFINSQTGL